MFPDSPHGVIAGFAYSALLVYAAAGDVIWRRIPNKLVLLLIVFGLAYSMVVGQWGRGALVSAGGFATGFLIWLPFHALGWLGAGDVKLYAAAGTWLGPFRAVEGAGMAALAGGVLALLWMIASYGARHTWGSLWLAAAFPSALAPHGDSTKGSRRTLPYGVALAAGALAAGWMPRLLVFG